MIKNLKIKNFTIIDELEVDFCRGLNILTGETGAGKSVIIGAIDIVFGARASKDIIKTGETKAFIEAEVELKDDFDFNFLEENGIEATKVITISREITANDTRSRVNGTMVNQSYMQSLRKKLLDIHSQHDSYTYIQPKTHINLLDNYGKTEHKRLLENYSDVFKNYKNTQKEFEQFQERLNEISKQRDFLEFQINEIESTSIKDAAEYNNLIKEREILINAEELKTNAYNAYAILYEQEGSILEGLKSVETLANKIASKDISFDPVLNTLSESLVNLKEASREISRYAENVELNEQRLSEVEERIEALDKLKRKYGPEITDIINNLEKFKKELDEIVFGDENLQTLKDKTQQLKKEAVELAEKISEERRGLANELSNLIVKDLKHLEIPNAEFDVKIERLEALSSNGFDNVEFMISTNKGEPVKPLAKIASGGEVSRIMLVLKKIFARADMINTVIFDEIDTGISGKTSQAVAEELADLSLYHQVICITHQPIIASMADRYFYVTKKPVVDGGITAKLDIMETEDKTNALAKLASGQLSEDSISFARKLIENSNAYKTIISSSKKL